MSQIPKLPGVLRQNLERVEPSKDKHGRTVVHYYPCSATRSDGEQLDRVCVTDAQAYYRVWGIWPWDDGGKLYVPLSDIADLESSQYRLPATLASKLYDVGESGMGYYRFAMILRDGRQIPTYTGGLVDFPGLPPEITSEDIVDVIPDADIEMFAGVARPETPPYYWSLYRSI